jgi:ribosomal protein S25
MHTRQQKRELEDPGDVSIARAPQAPKKSRKKPVLKAPADPTTAAPNTILPASLANPTPTDLAPPPTADVPNTTSDEQAATSKLPKKKSAKKGTAKTTPANVLTESHNDAKRKAIPTDNTQPSSQRRITPSSVAQQGMSKTSDSNIVSLFLRLVALQDAIGMLLINY